jgi:pimeloyl-ACP methyl ester carboxylesterase
MADLVFIHGAGDSGAIWQRQLERFDGAHRTLAVDLPGHGSRLTEQALSTVEQIADDVVRQIEERDITAPILIGHSMGGATALMIALTKPRLARALVLAGSGARLRIQPHVIEAARNRAASAPPGQISPRVIPLDEVTSAEAPTDARAWVQQHFGQSTAQATYADFLATNVFDVMGRLETILLPALVIAGEEDAWTPPKFQYYFADYLPSVRLVLLPRAGHYPFVEQEEAFNGELERFLADIEPEAERG